MSFEQVIYDNASEISQENEIISQYSGSQIPESNFRISLRSSNKESSEIEQESDVQLNSDSVNAEIILCLNWKSGKLGAAYYNSSDSELYILNDIVDINPDFIIMKTLYNQIKPTHCLTMGTLSSKFVSAIASIAQSNDTDSNESSSAYETVRSLPHNLQLLKKDEYSYDLCVHAIKSIQLASEPKDLNDEERFIYINSVVNFDKKVTVHALGALLIFLNKYRATINNDNRGPIFLNINTISIKDIVLIDSDTIRALNIFSTTAHPAAFKRGNESSNKEGFSVFKLFNRCKSSLGRSDLRIILVHPTNNISVLLKRHEFIEFCSKPINNGIVSGIQECLKNIFPISSTLCKIHGSCATIANWKLLRSTLDNILLVQQMIEPYTQQVEIFREFEAQIEDVLSNVLSAICGTIDFDNSVRNKIVVKNGVDEELDTKKRYVEEVRNKINLAASYEIENLPPYIKDCYMSYIPQIGYLVCVQKWTDDADQKAVEKYGFRHMFTLGKYFYYKSSVCDELDKCFGDIYTEIESHESRVITRLSEYILAFSSALKRPLKTIAHFDSLISIAKVCKELGYVRPNLVVENVIDIQEGKHPLLDLSTPNFVPNTFESGINKSLVKIITGPNNSGKSIYLKQTALIVYLAHIGSYVPAKNATIGMMHSIYSSTCINSNESAAVSMSSFAVDLRQISQAHNNSKKNSLILIDEFGKATTELDGLALLTSYLEHFLVREECCPHILVSTHYLHLTNLFPETKLVQHFKCEHKLSGEKIVFLYKIVKGISSSFAKYTAICSGLSEDIILRSEEILKCFRSGAQIKRINEK